MIGSIWRKKNRGMGGIIVAILDTRMLSLQIGMELGYVVWRDGREGTE